MKVTIAASVAVVALSKAALGYGPTAHEIVGGVADKLLANTPAAAQIASLLDGISLEKAAVIPDEIKAWDKDGPDDPEAFPHYPDHPKIDKELREFWRANPPTHDRASAVPSHHWFHYTDVPVANVHKYSDGQTGRGEWDIVHVIGYCVAVLRGDTPEENPRKITKPIAVILLAHFLADIHEPMHVGAQYFDEAGRTVDPDKGQAGISDEGGNTIALRLFHGTPEAVAKRGLKLHGFWDNEAVMSNLGLPANIPKEQRYEAIEKPKRRLIEQFAHEQPANWRLPASVPLKNYAETWADEILPVAREAHERLQFSNVHRQEEQDRTVAAGAAQEKIGADRVAYADWAAKIVREGLHKAGWRLADLLTQAVTATSAGAAAPAAVATPTGASSPEVTSATPTPPATPAYGEYPANYKAIVTSWLQANHFDALAIEWQTEPKPAEIPAGNGRHLSGYLVIFNAPENSRPKTRSVLIRDGVVINSSGF